MMSDSKKQTDSVDGFDSSHCYVAELDKMIKAVSPFCTPNFSDDAVIYAGSMKWEDWQNHVPIGLQALWPKLSDSERKCIFLCCASMTAWTGPPSKAT